MVVSKRRCGFLLGRLLHAVRLSARKALYGTISYRCATKAPVKQYLKERQEFGAYATHIDRLLTHGTTEMYKKQFGMTRAEYQSLYMKVRLLLEPKNKARKTTSISAREQLILTLSYLKSGCSQGYIGNQFMISRNRISVIIKKVTTVIVSTLSKEFDFRPRSAACWKKIADRFYERWQLPNCIGAVDGKHCFITKFGKTGSYTINYHGWPSVVLLAVCDADYIIRHFNVGSFGGRSDGGIWSEDILGRGLASGQFLQQGFIPAAEPLPGDEQQQLGSVNHYIVCDDAFKLLPHCMKPYSGQISKTQDFTNYRFSRGRMTIECVFGHLSRRWKILNHLTTGEETTRLIIKCLVHLHNFLRLSRFDDPNELKLIETGPQGTFGQSLSEDETATSAGADNDTDSGERTRKKLHYYFNHVGPVFEKH